MLFQVKVLTNAMAVEDRQVTAMNEAEARKMVASTGAEVLDIRSSSRPLRAGDRKHKFDLIVFNQQLHSLLDAGQTILDAIEMLGKNDRRGRNRTIYDNLLKDLKEGKQLSSAMEGLPSVFPALYVAMVRSSETTGTVRASIDRYLHFQRQVEEVRRKLVAAATYPAILLGVGFLVISFLMLYVLPRFSEVYEDAGDSGQTGGFVRWWGGFVRANEMLAWGSLGMVVVAMVTLALHPWFRRALFARILALPVVGERILVLQLARFYRTLGMLLGNGVSVIAAMKMTRGALPEAMHQNLDRASKAISEGIAISSVMRDNGLSTEIAVRLLGAGESSGNLHEMMGRIADFYDQETSIWIDTAGRLIEPVLMLGIGLVVGAIVLMLYSPIFDLANIV